MDPSTLQIGPPPEKSRATVILLHGRGSSAHDIIQLHHHLGDTTNITAIAPFANGGTWYPNRFLVPTTQNEPHLSDALSTIAQIHQRLTAGDVPTSRIALIGFSQGACLALEYAFRNPSRYAFVAGLSGALIGPLDTPRRASVLQQTPLLLSCADHDPHIPAPYIAVTEETLRQANAQVTRQRFPGSDHTLFPEQINWIRDQLSRL